jgi:hypothetical protein
MSAETLLEALDRHGIIARYADTTGARALWQVGAPTSFGTYSADMAWELVRALDRDDFTLSFDELQSRRWAEEASRQEKLRARQAAIPPDDWRERAVWAEKGGTYGWQHPIPSDDP